MCINTSVFDTSNTSILKAFTSTVWEMGERHARHELPWRFNNDPYAVAISEIMLQQTQVARVVKFWAEWIQVFPCIDALACATKAEVLEMWQGLGYNRRALAAKQMAEVCSLQYAGSMPSTYEELIALPGIGPATAAGIVAFAYEKPCVYLETNVRAVYIHHFFSESSCLIHDREIIPLIEQTCSHEKPREWYYALLDYGAYLKKHVSNPTRRAKAYVKQSSFEGSIRQKRSFIIRMSLGQERCSVDEVFEALNKEELIRGRTEVPYSVFSDILHKLESEGFFVIKNNYIIPS